MNINLEYNDVFRINADSEQENFIIVTQENYEAMAVTAFTICQYVEIRKKGGQLKIFFFKNKSHKKECNFGYWEDAEVVFAINEVRQDPK